MAQQPARKRKTMLRTTLEQEKKAAKRDPEGAASVKKKAATIGNVIMGLSLGSPIPAAVRNISAAVMKQLSKRQLAKLKKLSNKKAMDKEAKESFLSPKQRKAAENKAGDPLNLLKKGDLKKAKKKSLMSGSNRMYMENL